MILRVSNKAIEENILLIRIKKEMIHSFMIGMPLLIEFYGIAFHVNPISPNQPLTLAIAFVLTGLVVRQCEVNAGNLGVPDEKSSRVKAFLFSLVRTLDIIIICWLPREIFDTAYRADWANFVILEKYQHILITYIGYLNYSDQRRMPK